MTLVPYCEKMSGPRAKCQFSFTGESKLSMEGWTTSVVQSSPKLWPKKTSVHCPFYMLCVMKVLVECADVVKAKMISAQGRIGGKRTSWRWSSRWRWRQTCLAYDQQSVQKSTSDRTGGCLEVHYRRRVTSCTRLQARAGWAETCRDSFIVLSSVSFETLLISDERIPEGSLSSEEDPQCWYMKVIPARYCTFPHRKMNRVRAFEVL